MTPEMTAKIEAWMKVNVYEHDTAAALAEAAFAEFARELDCSELEEDELYELAAVRLSLEGRDL